MVDQSFRLESECGGLVPPIKVKVSVLVLSVGVRSSNQS